MEGHHPRIRPGQHPRDDQRPKVNIHPLTNRPNRIHPTRIPFPHQLKPNPIAASQPTSRPTTEATRKLPRKTRDGVADHNSNLTLMKNGNNFRYSETADRLSVLFRDQPQTPLERAVYWAEFNLRHNGAKHLRLGSRHLAPYQRSLLDVYAVITAIIAIPVVLLAIIICKCCCSSSFSSTSLKKSIPDKRKKH